MSKSRILIAHKDREAGDRLGAAIEACGLEPRVVYDGSQANRLVDSEPYAAIVVTAKLDNLSGLQVAATTRASTANGKIPIFVITPSDDREVRNRCEQMRAQIVNPTENETAMAKAVAAAMPQVATYDVRLINSFVSAVSSIFKSYLTTAPEIGKAAIKKDELATGYVSALIDFTGNGVRGSMALSFDRGMIKALHDKIYAEMNTECTDESMADLAGEMANQACGVVKSSVGKLGLKVMIGLPKVVLGEGHRIIHVVKNPTLVLLVQLGKDRCSVEFCMTRVDKEDFQETETNDKLGGDVVLF